MVNSKNDRRIGGRKSSIAIVKEIIRGEYSVAMRFERRTVPFVCSTLGDQRDLRAGGSALVGVRIRRRDAKFLDGFRIQSQYRRTDGVGLGFINVHTIQGDVRLVA